MGRGTWLFDFNTLTWSRQTDSPGTTQNPPLTAFDPVTGHIFQQGYNQFREFDPAANTWTVRGNEPSAGWVGSNMNSSVDPARRLFVAVGQGFVRMWDLSTWTFSTITTSGDSSIVSAGAPGFEYDPVLRKFVAWSGGTDVFLLDMATRAWTRVGPAAANTVTPTPVTASGGTFGRFRYIPSKNAYIAVNGIDQNVFAYKLSPGGVGPTLPVVSVDSADANASEPGTDTATFSLTRTGSTSSALTVEYTIGGTATGGSDFAPLTGSVTFPVGASSATVTLTPLDDSRVEGAESVILTLSAGAAYTPGSPSTATITIADDDVGADTDGDGMPDAWETRYGLNPTSASDATADPDGDGLTNLQEYQLGSDPTNPGSPGAGGGGGGVGVPADGDNPNGDHFLNDTLCGAGVAAGPGTGGGLLALAALALLSVAAALPGSRIPFPPERPAGSGRA